MPEPGAVSWSPVKVAEKSTIFSELATWAAATVVAVTAAPKMAVTLSLWINLVAALVALAGLPSSSSRITSILRPSMPPLAFISSRASSIPCLMEFPIALTGPTKERITPMVTGGFGSATLVAGVGAAGDGCGATAVAAGFSTGGLVGVAVGA